MPLGPSSGGIGPECSRGSPGSLWSPGERVCTLPQLQREAKKKGIFFLSAGPISDPAPDAGNVFNGLLGLNFPNFFYHLCK